MCHCRHHIRDGSFSKSEVEHGSSSQSAGVEFEQYLPKIENNFLNDLDTRPVSLSNTYISSCEIQEDRSRYKIIEGQNNCIWVDG